MIAMLPANISAARRGVLLRGRPATALWLRGADADSVHRVGVDRSITRTPDGEPGLL